MSVEAIATVLHHSRATGTAKVVLIGIANHAGDGGSWPTIATLAKYAGVNERNVQVALRKLEELGEIEVHLQAGGTHRTDPRYRSNRYEILVSCPPDCDRTTSHHCDGDDAPDPADEPTTRGDDSDTPHAQTGVTTPTPLAPVRGVDSDASGVSPASPEPSYNHPDTPQPPDVDASTSSPLGSSTSSRCPIHPAGDGKRCRGCGTNPKAVLDQKRRAADDAARAAERERILTERRAAAELRRRGPSPTAAAELERIRQQLAGAR